MPDYYVRKVTSSNQSQKWDALLSAKSSEEAATKFIEDNAVPIGLYIYVEKNALFASENYCFRVKEEGLEGPMQLSDAIRELKRKEEETRNKEVDKRENTRVEKQRENHEQYIKLSEKIIQRAIIDLKSKMSRQEPSFLYDNVFLAVDSMSAENAKYIGNNEFSTSLLIKSGLDGWEIVGVIPKTQSEGLLNYYISDGPKQTWGEGSGGNIVGAYILLKAPLASFSNRETHLKDFVSRHIYEFATDAEVTQLKDFQK